MRVLVLLRHGLTEANERRLYCGRTDLPLSPRGEAMARELHRSRPLPECDLYVTSGMRRADATLALLTGHTPGRVLPTLREMDFGRFEMLCYEDLKAEPDYQRWIWDETGMVPCPGGECSRDFIARVRLGGAQLLALEWESALVVCHGGTVVRLMEHWFPDSNWNYYDWQPAACGGWRVTFDDQTPVGYDQI